MEGDLPSLSNQAAIELDDYLLNRSRGFEAVIRLASRLASNAPQGIGSAPATTHFDPLTIGVVSRAIDELIMNPAERPQQIAQVVQFAAELADRLRRVSETPTIFSREELETMRHECLVLSESASGSESPLDESDPRHRFRS